MAPCHFRILLAAALLLPASALPTYASDKPQAMPVLTPDAEAQAQAAVEVVDAFSAALKRGDIEAASGYLHPDLLVLESGGAERSRAEYLAEHAGADAEFLRDATIVPLARRAAANGDLAWVASESRIEYQREGAGKQSLSTETMVLKRGAEGWRIVHIHWSSRPAPEVPPTP